MTKDGKIDLVKVRAAVTELTEKIAHQQTRAQQEKEAERVRNALLDRVKAITKHVSGVEPYVSEYKYTRDGGYTHHEPEGTVALKVTGLSEHEAVLIARTIQRLREADGGKHESA
jgi:hypothetical protein